MKPFTKNLLAIALGCGFSSFILCGLEAYFGNLERSKQPVFKPFPISESLVANARKVERRHAVATTLARRSPVQWIAPVSSISRGARLELPDDCCEFTDHLMRPRPGAHVAKVVASDGAILHEATYSIDEHHHRKSTPPARDADRFAVFLGCSFVYGVGVKDDQTIPSLFQKHAPRFHAYNFAFGAYGPHHLLARALAEDPRRIVNEKSGAVFYVVIDSHVPRATGSMRWVGGPGRRDPYFFIDTEDRLQQNGHFASGRPWWTRFSSLAVKSEILKYFDVDFPARFDETTLDLFVRLIEATRETYLKNLPSSEFYVVFYPGASIHEVVTTRLEKRGIRYFDYGADELWMHTKGSHQLGDGHPSAEANEVFAEQLAKDFEAQDKK